jgi:hypothetical protein
LQARRFRWRSHDGDGIEGEAGQDEAERADSIGPWLDSLEFLTWLGNITSAGLVNMFSGGGDGFGPDVRPYLLKLSSLLLCVFCSEHIYLVVRMAARTAISKLNTPNMRKERGERYMTRKKYLEELCCLLPWFSVFRPLPSSKTSK